MTFTTVLPVETSSALGSTHAFFASFFLLSILQELKALMARHNTLSSQQPSNSRSCFPGCLSSSQGQHKYHFERATLVSQVGNCRVMAYCDPLSCLVVSQPSPQSTLIPGELPAEASPYVLWWKWFFHCLGQTRGQTLQHLDSSRVGFLLISLLCVSGCGIKMMSAVNSKSSQYVPIHSKQIRGLAFSNRADGLLLSAALDHTLKLTRWVVMNMMPASFLCGPGNCVRILFWKYCLAPAEQLCLNCAVLPTTGYLLDSVGHVQKC